MLGSMRPARTQIAGRQLQQHQPALVRHNWARQGRITKCQSSLALQPAATWPATGATAAQVLGELASLATVDQPAVPALPPPPRTPVANLTPETWNEFLKAAGDNIVLVDFYTDWCGPCQLMHKEMDKMTHAFPKGVVFAKFNCGPHPAFSTSQRIKALPTFKLFQRGRCIDQVSGAQPIKLRQLLTHYYRPARK